MQKKNLNSKTKKLEVTYSLFSGEELLEASIASIRDNVDYINVVYQDKSWFGDDASKNIDKFLQNLKELGLIDNYIHYQFSDFGDNEKINNAIIEKKQLGIDDLRKNNCTHCMLMDTDEFYIAKDFKEAKEYIYQNNITHSCCPIYDYKKSQIYRERDVRNYSVPFILQLREQSKVSPNHNIPCYIDPLRCFEYNPCEDKFYYFTNVVMHHMTGIRKDFDKKLNASITNTSVEGKKFVDKFREKHNQFVKLSDEEIKKQGYIVVDDIFNIGTIK